MCRSIKVLRRPEPPPATDVEIQAAALQFIRKVSGFPKPSKANHEAFHRAVAEVTAATRKLLRTIETNAPRSANRTADDQALLNSSGSMT